MFFNLIMASNAMAKTHDPWTLSEWLKYCKGDIDYWMKNANESAGEGVVENVISCFKHMKKCENFLLEAEIGELQKKKDEILNLAYKNGIEKKLNYFAKGFISLVEKTLEDGGGKSLEQLVEETRHKNNDIFINVSLAYGSLNDARKYAEIIGVNIEERASEIEEKLNSLGLHDFLSRPKHYALDI